MWYMTLYLSGVVVKGGARAIQRPAWGEARQRKGDSQCRKHEQDAPRKLPHTLSSEYWDAQAKIWST